MKKTKVYLSRKQTEEIFRMIDEGYKHRAIANKFNVHITSIGRWNKDREGTLKRLEKKGERAYIPKLPESYSYEQTPNSKVKVSGLVQEIIMLREENEELKKSNENLRNTLSKFICQEIESGRLKNYV